MRTTSRLLSLLLILCLLAPAFGTAYQNRPKLIVVIIIDQFRGDYQKLYDEGIQAALKYLGE